MAKQTTQTLDPLPHSPTPLGLLSASVAPLDVLQTHIDIDYNRLPHRLLILQNFGQFPSFFSLPYSALHLPARILSPASIVADADLLDS